MADGSGAGRDTAARVAGAAAAACFVGALLGFGAALEGFRHDVWPVAVLGASGVPRATTFNLCAYLLPGLLAAFVAHRARVALPPSSGADARIGWTLALLAALAFAAQGLLPLEASAADAGGGRLHGAAWAAWGIAFTAAAVSLALASARRARWPAALAHLGAGALVSGFGWLSGALVAAPLAQRLAFAAWLAWVAGTGWRLARAAR